jgi:ketosteroid isomerase-like protein
MTIAIFSVAASLTYPLGSETDAVRCPRRTIERLVEGFATQDLDGIMSLFAEDAVYCDILGKGRRGDEFHGKAAIRHAIARQFDLGGLHTYEDARIMVEGNRAFASWTLVAGDADDPAAQRFEGIDEFCLNDAAHVTLKKAWLKGLPRLRRTMLVRNPSAMFRHFGYAVRSWGK